MISAAEDHQLDVATRRRADDLEAERGRASGRDVQEDRQQHDEGGAEERAEDRCRGRR